MRCGGGGYYKRGKNLKSKFINKFIINKQTNKQTNKQLLFQVQLEAVSQ
jgi:hypothetical protein